MGQQNFRTQDVRKLQTNQMNETKRKNIKHFSKLSHAELVSFFEYVRDELGFVISQDNCRIDEKIDGFGFRFGMDRDGFFVESSRSGILRNLRGFSEYEKKHRGYASERSKGYDHLSVSLFVDPLVQYTLKESYEKFGPIKVVCEVLYPPFGYSNGDEITFLTTSYSKKIISKTSIFVINVLDENGNKRDDAAYVLRSLCEIKGHLQFFNTLSCFEPVYLEKETNEFFRQKVLTSGHMSDKIAHECGKKILASATPRFGEEMEGIVITLDNGPKFKITNEKREK